MAQESVAVFENGKSHIYLDVDKQTLSKWEQIESPVLKGQGGAALPAALEDLRRCFHEMTGAELSQTAAAGLVPLRLHRDPAMAGPMDHQDYQIAVRQEEILITAPSRLGLLNGVYGLLDGWGCRWVMPNAFGEVIPQRDRLSLKLGVRTIHFPMDSRTNYTFKGPNASWIRLWLQRNQAAYGQLLSGQHYWLYAISPAEYFEKHPEYFALIDGQRRPTQLCTTHPQVIELMIQKARQFFKDNPAYVSFPMDPADNNELCQCDRCRALDPPGSWKGQPLLTDRVIQFANIVAEAIEKDFPDRYVALCAYGNHLQPPVRIQPRDNVVVLVTRSGYCYLHLTPSPHCEGPFGPAAFEKVVQQWCSVCSLVGVYEYDPIFWTGHLPCPIYLEVAGSVQRQIALGVRARQIDLAWPDSASNFVNQYLDVRFRSHPDLAPEQELESMCRAFFGPAGEAMTRYYLALSKVAEFDSLRQTPFGGGMGGYDRIFSPEMVRSARAAMNDAQSQVKQKNLFQRRVEMVNLSLEYLEAYLEGVWSAQAGRHDSSIAGFDRAHAKIDELDQIGHMPDVVDAHRRLNTAKLKTIAKYFPDQLEFFRTWHVLGPLNNDHRDAFYRPEAIETQTRLLSKSAAKLPEDVATWRQYTSREGFVNLSTAFKKVQTPWTMSYAYAAIRIRSPKAMDVQFRMDSFNAFRVYLNGKEVYKRPGLDADVPDKRTFPVALPVGESTILIKDCQTAQPTASFQWGFYFRITNTAGNPIREIETVPWK